MRLGRLAAGGPPRGPRTSHGRERARSGGEALAAAGPAGAHDGATPLGAHPDAKTVGLGALAIVGLVRALQRRAPSRRSRAARSRGPRGRRKRLSVRLRSGSAQRGAAFVTCLGKTPTSPCRTRTPVLRCAPRSAPGLLSGSSGVSQLARAEPVQHIWAISTPVDSLVDKVDGGREDHPQWSRKNGGC